MGPLIVGSPQKKRKQMPQADCSYTPHVRGPRAYGPTQRHFNLGFNNRTGILTCFSRGEKGSVRG